MSPLGQKQTLKRFHPMSALPPKADIRRRECDVRFVPKADMLFCCPFLKEPLRFNTELKTFRCGVRH
jgi:hypothetical protein